MNRSIKTLALAFILAAALLKPGSIKAQEQEMQQLLLDIEKLTQMKSILSDMKTGYQIYQQGYGTISAISKGNFDLHNLYLSGLLAVNPAVRNYGRIADILLMQSRLVSEYKEKSGLFRKSGSFSISELNYMGTVYARLVSETLNDLEELTNIVTAGKLRMSDAERIRGIDRIYSASSDKLGFLRSFNDQEIMLSLQRTKEAGDTRSLKQLYGLNN